MSVRRSRPSAPLLAPTPRPPDPPAGAPHPPRLLGPSVGWPGRPWRRGGGRLRRLVTAIGAVLVVAGLATAARGEVATRSAAAAVTPTSGFAGTVAGWTSWYGAYDLADLGWAWCIDHGSSAPDPDLIYAPTSIGLESGADTRAAMAWAASMNPPHDPVTAAAIMLALHDLRGAVYPTGPLDLARLGPGDLAGFGGAEGAVLDRARAIVGDARAHAHLREPFALQVVADRAAPGTPGALRVTLTDAGGTAVVGVHVELAATGAVLTGGATVITGPDGTAWAGFEAGTDNRFAARAVLPRTEPRVHAPTVGPAQRVIVPSSTSVDGADGYVPTPATTTTIPPTTTTIPPTTTTTRPPSTTTTTRPATTTTTRRPTTTTTAPPSTTTTSRPPASSTTSTTSTTAPASTTTTIGPTTTSTTSTTSPPAAPPTSTGPRMPAPPAPPSASPPRPSLPRTGRPLGPWALVGVGLIACGWALVGPWRRPAGSVAAP